MNDKRTLLSCKKHVDKWKKDKPVTRRTPLIKTHTPPHTEEDRQEGNFFDSRRSSLWWKDNRWKPCCWSLYSSADTFTSLTVGGTIATQGTVCSSSSSSRIIWIREGRDSDVFVCALGKGLSVVRAREKKQVKDEWVTALRKASNEQNIVSFLSFH